MDIIATLKAEHAEVRKLLRELDGTTDRAAKTRAELRATIEMKLMGHAKGEEAVVYPAYKARADKEGLKTHAEAVLEHAAVEKVVLAELRAADPQSREFAGAAKVLKEFVEHHAKEEEKTMLPDLRKLYETDERAEIDAQYKAWKRANGF